MQASRRYISQQEAILTKEAESLICDTHRQTDRQTDRLTDNWALAGQIVNGGSLDYVK